MVIRTPNANNFACSLSALVDCSSLMVCCFNLPYLLVVLVLSVFMTRGMARAHSVPDVCTESLPEGRLYFRNRTLGPVTARMLLLM